MGLTAVERAQALELRAAEKPQQLEIWPDHVRGLPNALARCALFTAAGDSVDRRKFDQDLIASLEGSEMSYTGTELRQDELDVFLQIVHFARPHPVGCEFVVSGYAILKALGWGTGRDNYARLKQAIRWLVEGTVWMTWNRGRMGYAGHLIDSLTWIDETGHVIDEKLVEDPRKVRWQFRLDPKLVKLFARDEFTRIEWAQRTKLSPLEKWLHSFYVTHTTPFAIKVETLYNLCGSSAKRLYHFRESLRKALDKLKHKDIGFFEACEIDEDDLVHVRRVQKVIA